MRKEDIKVGVRIADKDSLEYWIDIVYVDDKGYFGYDYSGDGIGYSFDEEVYIDDEIVPKTTMVKRWNWLLVFDFNIRDYPLIEIVMGTTPKVTPLFTEDEVDEYIESRYDKNCAKLSITPIEETEKEYEVEL